MGGGGRREEEEGKDERRGGGGEEKNINMKQIPNMSTSCTNVLTCGVQLLPLVLSMDICSVLQEEFHNLHTIVASSEVEGSREPTTHVPTVHVLGSAETLERKRESEEGKEE